MVVFTVNKQFHRAEQEPPFLILIQQSAYMLSTEHLYAYLCASVILFGNIYIFKVKYLLESQTSLFR